MAARHYNSLRTLIVTAFAVAAIAGCNDSGNAASEQTQELAERVDALEQELTAAQDHVATLQSQLATAQQAITDLTASVTDANELATQNQMSLGAVNTGQMMLMADVDAIENSDVMAMDDYVEVHESSPSDTGTQGPIVRVTGANLQVVHGANDPTAPTGVGNIVLGYDRLRDGTVVADAYCSDGTYDNQTDCEADGATWAVDQKTGSHNLVVGERAFYTQSGAIVGGFGSVANRLRASVLGGYAGQATAVSSTVVGGSQNEARGELSVIVGGDENASHSPESVMVGGYENEIYGNTGVAVGGRSNTALAYYSVAVGGSFNDAQADESVVVGGYANTVSADNAVVTGGYINAADGIYSVVSGGKDRTTTGFYDWVGGSLTEED